MGTETFYTYYSEVFFKMKDRILDPLSRGYWKLKEKIGNEIILTAKIL